MAAEDGSFSFSKAVLHTRRCSEKYSIPRLFILRQEAITLYWRITLIMNLKMNTQLCVFYQLNGTFMFTKMSAR